MNQFALAIQKNAIFRTTRIELLPVCVFGPRNLKQMRRRWTRKGCLARKAVTQQVVIFAAKAQ